VICFHALFIVYFFGLWLAGTKRNLDNEKKECMGEMKVDGLGRKVKLRQLLLIFWLSRCHVSYFRYVVIGKCKKIRERIRN
jgi:hypothetical protein